LVLLLVSALTASKPGRGTYAFFTVAACAGAIASAGALWARVMDSDRGAFTTAAGALTVDGFSVFFVVVISLGIALAALLSDDFLRREDLDGPELYVLLLFSGAGGIVMAMANDLIVIFLGLEMLSIALYVLAGFNRRAPRSRESAIKYFVLGSFSSAFLLYGIALVYGATGATNLDRIAAASAGRAHDPLFMLGLGLLLVGFGFKISAVPFHMWVPDVYQGAPTSIAALIATGSKAAAFAALIRVLVVAMRGAQPDWTVLFWALAAVTMTVGNVVAIAQSNVKRMLAYSSVAHAGYMLVGLVAGGAPGTGAVLFYLLAYTFTTAGAFGVLTLCRRAGEEAVEVGDYAGLGTRHPALAAALALFLLSLIGIPPLAGFAGKFYLFGAAVRTGYVGLAVIGVLNSALAAYYYLRVVVYMYMREPEGAGAVWAPSFAGGLALAIALVGVVLLGVIPAPFADLAQAAVAPLLR